MEYAAVIAALADPAFYPHRPDRVEHLQTHISHIFLAGPYVYKLKKPVRFSFLDFSTVERRHHFCREEIRLNRRLCPVVYLDVLRRAGLSVTVAGLQEGLSSVRGSHDIAVQVDSDLGSIEVGEYDMIVLPGGMPGTKHLMQDQRVLAAVRAHHHDQPGTAALAIRAQELEPAQVRHPHVAQDQVERLGRGPLQRRHDAGDQRPRRPVVLR